MHPALRNLADDARAALVRVLAYLCALFVVGVVAVELATPPAGGAVEPPARAEWSEIARPHPAFAASFSDLGEADLRYGIRRHASGQGRKDTMAWGEPTGARPSALIEVYRPGREFTGFADPVAEVLARLPDLPLAEGVRGGEVVKTKFGPVRLIDFALDRDGAVRRCLGFARTFADPALLIVGWYCAGGPEIVARTVVTCAIDRLTLLGAGSEPRIGALFAQAELRRNFCGHNGLILAATPKRPSSWIEAGKAPKLRGRLAAR